MRAENCIAIQQIVLQECTMAGLEGRCIVIQLDGLAIVLQYRRLVGQVVNYITIHLLYCG